MKEWRNEAAFESDGSQGRNPVAILYGHELIIKLIEAAWLLKDRRLGKIGIKENEGISDLFIETERKKFHDYSQHLTKRELMKPSSVLKETFKLHKLRNYRRILNIWLYDSLSTTFMEESLSKSEVITVYEQLVKLFEAMWLINERVKSKS